jgi:hypothetical protein
MLFDYKGMKDSLCIFFDIDGENCDEVVMLTPSGPMCQKHQQEFWHVRWK